MPLQPTLIKEVLVTNSVTNILFGEEENVGVGKRIVLCAGTILLALLVTCITEQVAVESAAFCACNMGEELETDVKPQCTTAYGLDDYSCPAGCSNLNSSENWRSKWQTSDYCGDGVGEGTYTCEPTVACCVAFMKHTVESSNTSDGTYDASMIDSTAQGNIYDQCPDFVFDFIMNAIISEGLNKVLLGPLTVYLFRQGTCCGTSVALAIIAVQMILAFIWVQTTVATEKTYGIQTGLGVMLNKWACALAFDIIFLDNVIVAAVYLVALMLGAETA